MKIDSTKLKELVEKRLVTSRVHPQSELIIYNYTAKAQYSKFWTKEIKQCRGLVCNFDGEIIARPFEKFFNLEEYDQPLPEETFEVYEKIDGSMGILYFIGNIPYIASRGSFDSPQAIKGSSLLHNQYKEAIPQLNKEKTYLFEIIYPENKFVVNYGKQNSLTLLAVIDTKTGDEDNIEKYSHLGFPIVQKFKSTNLNDLKELNLPNKEGFVVKFKNGLRLKIKFANYLELHAVVSKISELSIWKMLHDNAPFEKTLINAPDELYDWIDEIKNKFTNEFKKIELIVQKDFEKLTKDVDTKNRKDIAKYIATTAYPKLVFAMLDEKDYRPMIWNMLEPSKEAPFRLRKK